MSTVTLVKTVQEAREFRRVTRSQGARMVGMAAKTLEHLEYEEEKVRPHHIGPIAAQFEAPELIYQHCNSCPACFPKVPLEDVIETSLLANVAQMIVEVRETNDAFSALSSDTYGVTRPEQLRDYHRKLIEKAILEGADDFQRFRSFLLLLIKRYGYTMADINAIIMQGLGKEKTPANRRG